MEKYLLTTEDNPYDPITQWKEWLLYDVNNGYCTCERIARLANTSSILPEEVNWVETEAAMQKLLETGAVNRQGLFVKYKKVPLKEQKEEA